MPCCWTPRLQALGRSHGRSEGRPERRARGRAGHAATGLSRQWTDAGVGKARVRTARGGRELVAPPRYLRVRHRRGFL